MTSSIFKIRETPTIGITTLIKKTVLGSDGALYAHLDTAERINQLDNPLYLSLERYDSVLGNVTFCRRKDHWYIRYFAFEGLYQSSGLKQNKRKKNSGVKKELNCFFDDILTKGYKESKVKSFYAYVDPKNVKSVWITQELGFSKIGEIVTQTYSRINPRSCGRLQKLDSLSEHADQISTFFSSNNYFFKKEFEKGSGFVIREESGEIVAFAKTTQANWQIKRLPGKFGKLLIRLIPFIPGLNKIIKPKKHSFVVPEAVFVKDNEPALLTELFDGILHHESKNLMLWWVDPKESLYLNARDKMKWGILNKLVGTSEVDVICRTKSNDFIEMDKPFYCSGIDFV